MKGKRVTNAISNRWWRQHQQQHPLCNYRWDTYCCTRWEDSHRTLICKRGHFFAVNIFSVYAYSQDSLWELGCLGLTRHWEENLCTFFISLDCCHSHSQLVSICFLSFLESLEICSFSLIQSTLRSLDSLFLSLLSFVSHRKWRKNTNPAHLPPYRFTATFFCCDCCCHCPGKGVRFSPLSSACLPVEAKKHTTPRPHFHSCGGGASEKEIAPFGLLKEWRERETDCECACVLAELIEKGDQAMQWMNER